jgi:multimeric flavodoxin WrbA
MAFGMRLLVFNGSPRKNGNTSRVIELFAEAWRRLLAERGVAVRGSGPGGAAQDDSAHGWNVEIRVVRLADKRITPCRGCRICFDRGEEHCPVGGDDVPALVSAIRASDALVLASPVYVNDASGLMKTLIDRLAYVCHRPSFYRVAAMSLVTTAETPTRHALRTLQSALVSWGADPAVSLGLRTGALAPKEKIAGAHEDRIRRAAGKLIDAVRRVQLEKPSLLRLIVFRIQQRGWAGADAASLDYAYWNGNGWLDRRTSFFFPHKAGPLTRGAARVVGAAIGRFVR